MSLWQIRGKIVPAVCPEGWQTEASSISQEMYTHAHARVFIHQLWVGREMAEAGAMATGP